jgi:hypothetical protein
MHPVQSNLVGYEALQQQKSEPTHRMASTPDIAAASEKGQSEPQPVATDALLAAFTWLFGSGCY